MGVVVTSPLDWMMSRSSSGDASLSSPRSGEPSSPAASPLAAPGAFSAAATCSGKAIPSASFFIMLPPGKGRRSPLLPEDGAKPLPRPLNTSSW